MNLFAPVARSLPTELVEVILSAPHLRIERIVSTGHSNPIGFWYDQPQAEWVVVLQGQTRLLFEDEVAPLELMPGDHMFIAAHVKHRVEWTSPEGPTIWLAVFFDDPIVQKPSDPTETLDP